MTDICTTCKFGGLGLKEYPCNRCLDETDAKYWEAKEDELETTIH